MVWARHERWDDVNAQMKCAIDAADHIRQVLETAFAAARALVPHSDPVAAIVPHSSQTVSL
jgi:hypothetical protein